MRLRDEVSGLYGIADADFRPEVPLDRKVRWFLDGGARVVQVRMKRASARELFEAARGAVQLCRGRARVVVNDRPDVALAAGADGVHVGDEDLPVALVRRIVGPERLVGATVRTLESARQAAADGADYVGYGPVFATSTKQVPAELRGLDGLSAVARGSPIPVVAIAGLTVENAAEAARAGAAAAAVVSDVLGAADPVARARELVFQFARGAAEASR
jgi:thiamine-phosphate pyrophosphorylase